MDLQNIATHEIGYGIGLADIYDCDLETMYGYSGEGDIVKRDLYDGDITELQKLYE
jgi:predicted Zn-dependent protease